jgi:hypothetical protein
MTKEQEEDLAAAAPEAATAAPLELAAAPEEATAAPLELADAPEEATTTPEELAAAPVPRRGRCEEGAPSKYSGPQRLLSSWTFLIRFLSHFKASLQQNEAKWIENRSCLYLSDGGSTSCEAGLAQPSRRWGHEQKQQASIRYVSSYYEVTRQTL